MSTGKLNFLASILRINFSYARRARSSGGKNIGEEKEMVVLIPMEILTTFQA